MIGPYCLSIAYPLLTVTGKRTTIARRHQSLEAFGGAIGATIRPAIFLARRQ
jgi:hypothetical protein